MGDHSFGKQTTRLIHRNKVQAGKTTSTAYAKQNRKISFVL